jgi:hypothetical protein
MWGVVQIYLHFCKAEKQHYFTQNKNAVQWCFQFLPVTTVGTTIFTRTQVEKLPGQGPH